MNSCFCDYRMNSLSSGSLLKPLYVVLTGVVAVGNISTYMIEVGRLDHNLQGRLY